METEPAPQAPPGWYPDFWTPSRKRYWTGTAWTFATVDSAAVDDPPPLDASPLPDGHGLPAPVVRRPAAEGAGSEPPAKRKRPWLWGVAVLVGLIVGVIGVALSGGLSTDAVRPAAQRRQRPLGLGPGDADRQARGRALDR